MALLILLSSILLSCYDVNAESVGRVNPAPVEITNGNANLTAFLLSSGKRYPEFDKDVQEYTISLEYGTTTLTITPEAADKGSVIKFNGKKYKHKDTIPVELTGSKQKFTLEINSPSGAKKVYTFNVEYRLPYAVVETPKSDWLFWDDFENDSKNHLYCFYNVGPKQDKKGVFGPENGAGIGGSRGMQANFAAADGEDHTVGGLQVYFGKTPDGRYKPLPGTETTYFDEIYVRYYVKNEKSWNFGGADKMSRISSIQGPGGIMSQSMIAHQWSWGGEGVTGDYLILDPASGINIHNGNKNKGDGTKLISTRYNDFANLNWGLGGKNTVEGKNIPIFDKYHVGEWYAIEVHIKLNTKGKTDGIFQLWIDDALVVSMTNVNWIGSYNDPYGINCFYLENYCNHGVPHDMTRYFDNLVISRSKIGLAEANASPLLQTIFSSDFPTNQ